LDRNQKDDRQDEGQSGISRTVSRRDFLKLAGIAGAAVGMGAGLGGLASACGGEADETTTTAAAAPETTATTQAGGTTETTAAASEEAGGELKCGYVVPITGGMALFGAAAEWQKGWMEKNVWKDGLVCGDGKKYKITAIIGDSQSDSNRSAQVAADLITNTGVTLIGGSSSASNVIPVRDQAEALECPGVYYDCPGDAWAAGLTEPLKWNWCAWWAGKDVVANFFGMWDLVQTNKVVGGLWENTADGAVFAALKPTMEEMGMTVIDPGVYNVGTEDYSAIIGQFKKAGVEIVQGASEPGDFSNFWKQAVQQGFRPKVVTVAKALLFPQGVEALGELGGGMTVECWYHPAYTFVSDVTGMTAQQYCDAYTADTGNQWTQPVCFIGCFELWTDILKRTKDPTDKSSIVEAIKQTKVVATGGPVDWTVNPEPRMGFYNFCTKPIAGGQWIKGKGDFKYDMEIVGSISHPDQLKTTASMIEVQYPA
jgi:branched-chain amino acid transport system substrate-binding protein